MKRKYEIMFTFLTAGRKVNIMTFHIRRNSLENAIFDGYKACRNYLNKTYDVYMLESFNVNEVSINE